MITEGEVKVSTIFTQIISACGLIEDMWGEFSGTERDTLKMYAEELVRLIDRESRRYDSSS